jgi:hypothetical protein
MLLTQSYADLGFPKTLWPVGVYFDEAELTNNGGYGLNYATHVMALSERSVGKIVLNARFECVSGTAHPSYGRIRVRVTGDLYESSKDSLLHKEQS